MMTGFPLRFAIIFALMAPIGLGACSNNQDVSPIDVTDNPTQNIVRTEDPVAATVEGTLIYQSDVKRAAIAQGLIGPRERVDPTSNVYRVTLDELIDQRLLMLDAVKGGLVETEEAQRRLSSARERILSNLRVELYLAEAVSETAIRDLYEAQNNLGGRGEERRARQIVLPDEAAAADVLERLGDEEDFEVLAAERSIDPATAQSGGELGWLSRDMLPTALRDAVFNASVGDRIGPIDGGEGWYVLEILDRRVPNQRSFEEMREDIARFMTFEAVDALMTDLRDSAEIERTDMSAPAEEDDQP